MPIVAVFIILMLATTAAQADIYRYVNEDGVECFTDSPISPSATVYQRDPANRRRGGKESRPRPLKHAVTVKASEATVPASGDPESKPKLTFPPPVAGKVSSLVGMRTDPFDGLLRHHDGVDIAAREGSPVRAVAPGVVIFSGTRQGYGNTVIIDHGNGTQSLYAHNSSNLTPAGASVDESTVIALCGSTGRSTGPHLHFEAWRDGANITPMLVETWQGQNIDTSRLSLAVQDRIRRVVQPDGTLFFSNLPSSIP